MFFSQDKTEHRIAKLIWLQWEINRGLLVHPVRVESRRDLHRNVEERYSSSGSYKSARASPKRLRGWVLAMYDVHVWSNSAKGRIHGTLQAREKERDPRGCSSPPSHTRLSHARVGALLHHRPTGNRRPSRNLSYCVVGAVMRSFLAAGGACHRPLPSSPAALFSGVTRSLFFRKKISSLIIVLMDATTASFCSRKSMQTDDFATRVFPVASRC